MKKFYSSLFLVLLCLSLNACVNPSSSDVSSSKTKSLKIDDCNQSECSCKDTCGCSSDCACQCNS